MDNNFSLSELPIGKEARVTSINGGGRVMHRLMEMGVIPGAAVKIVKTAPFGDPIEVRVRGYSLAMRRSEAAVVEVGY